jgi:hypothetical protein
MRKMPVFSAKTAIFNAKNRAVSSGFLPPSPYLLKPVFCPPNRCSKAQNWSYF